MRASYSVMLVQQCSGEWDAHDSNMASYCFLVQKLSESFEGCEFLHVPHVENKATDTLAKIASSRQAIPSGSPSSTCASRPWGEPRSPAILISAGPKTAP